MRRVLLRLGLPAVGVMALLAPGTVHGQAGACGLPTQPPCPSPTPTPSATPGPSPQDDRAPAQVSLRASRAKLFYESPDVPPVRFSGRLRSAGSVRGVGVRLVGRTASGREAVIRRTRTDRSGRFSFRVRPPVSAGYRVEIWPGQELRGRSVRRRVLLQPDVRIGNKVIGGGLRIKGAVLTPVPPRGPAVRPGPRTRGHFYLKLRDEAFFRRVGTARVGKIRCKAGECRRRTAHDVTERSLLRRAERVLVCFGGRPYRDVGTRGRCPARFAAD